MIFAAIVVVFVAAIWLSGYFECGLRFRTFWRRLRQGGSGQNDLEMEAEGLDLEAKMTISAPQSQDAVTGPPLQPPFFSVEQETNSLPHLGLANASLGAIPTHIGNQDAIIHADDGEDENDDVYVIKDISNEQVSKIGKASTKPNLDDVTESSTEDDEEEIVDDNDEDDDEDEKSKKTPAKTTPAKPTPKKANKPAAKKPAAKKPATKKPATKKPAAKTPKRAKKGQ